MTSNIEIARLLREKQKSIAQIQAIIRDKRTLTEAEQVYRKSAVTSLNKAVEALDAAVAHIGGLYGIHKFKEAGLYSNDEEVTYVE